MHFIILYSYVVAIKNNKYFIQLLIIEFFITILMLWNHFMYPIYSSDYSNIKMIVNYFEEFLSGWLQNQIVLFQVLKIMVKT